MTSLAITARGQGAASDGLRDMAPAAVGVLPFATMIGVAVGASPMSEFGGWIAGLIVAGGSAHLALTASVTVGASFVAAAVTALLINARSLIYGALVGPSLRAQPRWFRWIAAYALVDQNFVMLSGVLDRDDGYVRRYYLAGTSLLWGSYMAGVAAGILVGPIIPASIPLGLAIPIMFLAMAVPTLTTRSAIAAGAVALATAILGHGLPAGLGTMAAIVTGTLAGAVIGDEFDA